MYERLLACYMHAILPYRKCDIPFNRLDLTKTATPSSGSRTYCFIQSSNNDANNDGNTS